MNSIARSAVLAALSAVSMFAAGCASDSAAPTTSSISEPAKVDPACVSLAAQIDQLSKEGTPDRLAAASSGKSATVPVKREALAKQAQLNKANADFRARCATITPRPQQQAAAVGAPPAAAAAPAAVASAPTAKAERVAPPKAVPRTALEEALNTENRQ
jgi:hypothetical protein